jgi:predicted outer membrane protein
MKIGTFRALCAAAVAGALAVPAMAQNTDTPTAANGARQTPNGAGGAEGEAGTVRPNVGQAQPGARPGTTARPGTPAGTIVEDNQNLPPGTRRANFPPQGERQGFAQGRQGQQGRLGDAALVRWISADNEAEIRISELAQQKSQNEQVKQFAKMMVDEHTKLGEQLQQASQNQGNADNDQTIEERTTTTRRNANAAATDSTRENATDAADNQNEQPNAARRNRREATDAANNDTDKATDSGNDNAQEGRNARNANRTTRTETETRTALGSRQGGGNNPAVAFHEQIKQECVASLTKELNSKNGPEFDKAFLGAQISAHMGMLDTLKTADQYASADLKQTLQQARQASEQHLQKAKQLMKQVESERQ